VKLKGVVEMKENKNTSKTWNFRWRRRRTKIERYV